jgi:hypothetical protein
VGTDDRFAVGISMMPHLIGRVGSGAKSSRQEDRWISYMQRGEFSAAWEVADQVLRERSGRPCWDWPRHLQYVWRGQPIAGRRVLVRCYHGLGDTVQFIRYARLLRPQAADVIVWAQPVLIPLLRTVEGIGLLLPLHDGTPEVDYDVDVEVMELPHVFRTTLDTLPKQCPYIAVPPGPAVRTSEEFAVGLIWNSGEWNPERSVPLRLFRALKGIEGVRLHAFQRGPSLREWSEDWGPVSGSDDVMTAAAAMRAMDLVISVDSFPAHLSGALGVPTWVLLMAEPDWRWMERGESSPWYPTMKLFRQEHAGDWASVLERVGETLRARVGAGRLRSDEVRG